MARKDIQAVYSLSNPEYEAFQMYWEGNTVSQIGENLNMTNSAAGKVLDSARDQVWNRMAEKRGVLGPNLVQNNVSTKETTPKTGSSAG